MAFMSKSSTSSTPANLTEKLFALIASVVFKIAFGKSFQGSNFDNHRFNEVIHEVEAVLGSYFAPECVPYVGWIIDRITGTHQRVEVKEQKSGFGPAMLSEVNIKAVPMVCEIFGLNGHFENISLPGDECSL
ncbi:hypothetical protein FEM48_Zijuj10G0049100 [Ziziphus jujuba var. spinosa]|uniref:Uncharacterized protein n=1 Tax=Ziziphus jujuba var. spinosa TaxID=714518 RepID=A0A978ULE9_ZIZJJ|nr:hypothetical protein FEM48_Zijuj10G0049100 [Ziziphus jujuba var. spinosa]